MSSVSESSVLSLTKPTSALPSTVITVLVTYFGSTFLLGSMIDSMISRRVSRLPTSREIGAELVADVVHAVAAVQTRAGTRLAVVAVAVQLSRAMRSLPRGLSPAASGLSTTSQVPLRRQARSPAGDVAGDELVAVADCPAASVPVPNASLHTGSSAPIVCSNV